MFCFDSAYIMRVDNSLQQIKKTILGNPKFPGRTIFEKSPKDQSETNPEEILGGGPLWLSSLSCSRVQI
uniref:Uncharacterized protein n=1 Tax=Arion vulgaris TaxID=1028688 RepID=A0A0B7BH15_9EUPU